MRLPAAALALVAGVLAIGAARQALGASIDPLLLPVLSGQSTAQALGLAVGGTAIGGTEPSAFSVSFRFDGSIDDLRRLGIRVGSVLGHVATAEVSVAELRLLASQPAVRSIEAARTLSLKLDTSVPLTGATQVRTQVGDGWSETSYTGRGVLIGIVDTGVDLSHPDFLKPDGSTRVLAVWDQSTSVGRPPRGFSYGAECTAEQIDARDCPEVDRDGHGTHVAGIAAGDGSATGGGQTAYRYIGMAPEADLLVVKLASLTTTRAIDALSYLKSKSVTLGKPIVVNLSFGSTLGPHDGTTDLEQAVDAFTGPDDQPGAVVVVAAGNDGQTITGNPLHAVACLQTGSTPPPCDSSIAALPGAIPAPVSFVVASGTTLAHLEIWYPGKAVTNEEIALGVAVTEPAACATGPASLAASAVVTASTPCGNIVIAAGDTSLANGDRRTIVTLTSASELTNGIWILSITGDSLPATGATRFDVWSDAQPSDNVPAFNTLGSVQTTIIAPASAAEAIAAVPYVSKIIWESLVGTNQLRPELGTLNNVATYASQGPLRPCTACGTLALKPDLAAPGLVIMSSFSSRVPDDPLLDGLIDPDRRHYALDGSSMAAPHVTGAAALLLQVNPLLTARQVKSYLLANVSTPQVPLPHPVEQWGQGRLNVQAAIAAMKAAGDDPPPNVPAGLRVTSVHSQRVALAWDAAPDLDLRSYQVLRRAEGDLLAALVREVSPTQTTIEDIDPLLTNETAYLYTVQAVDINGLSSGESPEVRAVPTAGDGSVGLCFIATAAYGSAWHPHVAALRAFRDRHLRPHVLGRVFIRTYETLSPPFARLIAPHPTVRAVTRAALTPLVLSIEHPRAAAAVTGLGLIGLLGLALRRRRA